MTRLAILTPRLDGYYGRSWNAAFERYVEALARQGLSAVPVDWRDAPSADVDAVLPLLAWGYHIDAPDWLAMLASLEASGIKTINPAALLRWNTRKTYLNDLEDADVPVVPTIFADRVTATVVEEARDLLGGGEMVLKPQISGGSNQTIRLAPSAALDGGPAGEAMIQPFLPSIATEGELSMLFFDGVFSHAVGKVAQDGDFRVQPQFGSKIGPRAPSDEAFEVAGSVFKALDQAPTYCRVDLIRHLDGSLRLMELEVIEPDLFLEHAPEAGATFAAAVVRALGL